MLKNEERRAAYQHFLSALELGPDEDRLDTSILSEPERHKRFEGSSEPPTAISITVDSDYDFYYYIPHSEFSLISVADYPKYEDFIFNLFKEEYPLAAATVRDIFIRETVKIKREEEEKARQRGKSKKYIRYFPNEGYDIYSKDIGITVGDPGHTTRDLVFRILVESRNNLQEKSASLRSLLNRPVKSSEVDIYTDKIANNNYETSLGELVEAIHKTFNPSGGSPASDHINTGTLEDNYLNVIETLEARGRITFKLGMDLLMEAKEEYDDDLSRLFA